MDELETISMAEFDRRCETLLAIDDEIKDIETTLKALNERKREATDKIIFILQKMDKTSYQVKGRKLILSQRATVQTPKTKEEKEAFFNWCREKGDAVYWQYVSVNSQSLNALYKAERDAAAEAKDLSWTGLPGVGKESIAYTLSIRK